MSTVQSSRSYGQSLIEILISATVAAIIFGGIASLVIVSLRASRASREVALAQSLIQDMSAAVRGLASQDWHGVWGSAGLVAYWAFDEGVNDRTFEFVNGNNGTITIGSGGSQTNISQAWQLSSNCKAGQCLSFDGTDDYVNIPISSSLKISGAITLSFWMYANAANTDSGLAGTGIGSGYQCTFHTGNIVYCYIQSGGNNVNASVGTAAWHHIAFTWDGTTGANGMKLYVDGSQVAQNASTISSMSGWGDFRIGLATTYFNGRIDEVRVYNRALSSTEIVNLLSGVSKLYPQNIGGIWQVKEGEETVTSAGITFLRSFSYGAVQRDSSGNIVSSGGNDDPSTKKVTYLIRWGSRQVTANEFITRSQTKIFIQTDWSGGSGEEGPISLTTNKFSSSTNVITTTTGEFRLKLTTE